MNSRLQALLAVLAVAFLGACGGPAPEQGGVAALSAEILRLAPGIDPQEARRAAEISYSYSQRLKREWRVTDPPLTHNNKVHRGEREKGLCNDWAQAMTRRLNAEGFRTLQIHWATSPPKPLRIIHHSAVISASGDAMHEGIILDPWRYGGDLYWARVAEDTRYNWRPRSEVREELLSARSGR